MRCLAALAPSRFPFNPEPIIVHATLTGYARR